MANPAFKSAFAASNTTADTTSQRLTIPTTGLSVGDLMIAWYCAYQGATQTTATPVVPSGWTVLQHDEQNGGGTGDQGMCAWHVATSADVSAQSFIFGYNLTTQSSAMAAQGGILLYTGQDTTTAIDASAKLIPTSGTSVTSPSSTATVTNDTAVVFYIDAGNSSTAPTTPTGTTSRQAITTNTAGTMRIVDAALSASGACPQYTSTWPESISPSGAVFAYCFTVLLMGAGSSGTSLGSAWAKASSRGQVVLTEVMPLASHANASSRGSVNLLQTLGLSAHAWASSRGQAVLSFAGSVLLNLGTAVARASSRGQSAMTHGLPLSARAIASAKGVASLVQTLSMSAAAKASSIASTRMIYSLSLMAHARASSRGTTLLGIPINAFDPLFWARSIMRAFYVLQPRRGYYGAALGRAFYLQPRRGMPTVKLPYSKDPREIKVITLDATADLPSGITLTGTPVLAVTVLDGVDPNPASAFGTPQINTSALNNIIGAQGTIAANMAVQIEAMGSIDGVVYEIAVTVPTTETPITETLKAVLVVSSS